MQRRNVTDIRRQAQTGLGMPSSTAFSGVIDNVIAAGGAAPNFAFSISHRLYTAYTGALFRVRDSTTTTETDISYAAATNLLDTAALAAACPSHNGTIVTIYDQSGNGRNRTQATPARQPKIYDSATGVLLVNNLPCSFHTGPATVGDVGQGWQREDHSGFAAAPNLTHFYAARFDADAGKVWDRFLSQLGGAGGNQSISIGADDLNDRLGTSSTSGGISAGSRRVFNVATSIRNFSYCVSRYTGGTVLQTNTTKRQNGSDLTENNFSGATTVSLANNRSCTGYTYTGTFGFNGSYNGEIGWEAVYANGSATLAALETFGATLNTLAGV